MELNEIAIPLPETMPSNTINIDALSATAPN